MRTKEILYFYKCQNRYRLFDRFCVAVEAYLCIVEAVDGEGKENGGRRSDDRRRRFGVVMDGQSDHGEVAKRE